MWSHVFLGTQCIHRYYEVKLLHTNKKWPFCACAQNITKISATYTTCRTYSRMSVIDKIPPHSKLIWDETSSRELTWPNIGQRAVWRVEVNEIKTILISISPVNQHYQHHNMSTDEVTQHISDIVFSWLRLLYSHSQLTAVKLMSLVITLLFNHATKTTIATATTTTLYF